MKKFLVILFLLLIGTSVYAQKRYAYIYYYYDTGGSGESTIKLSGCIPTGMETYYSKVSQTSVGTIIDDLAQRGYVVEQLSNASSGYNYGPDRIYSRYWEVVIMSITSGPTISKGDVNTDGEVNIADVNEVISLILGYVREHPEILEQIKK